LTDGIFVVLLAGNKSTQKQDIKLAREYLSDFLKDHYELEGEE
jgi:putative component of toxin-antitoxin plasmid stabilization module